MEPFAIVALGTLVGFAIIVVIWAMIFNKLAQLSGQVNLTIGTLAAQFEQRMNLIPDTLSAAREAVQAQRNYLDKMLEVRKGMHPGMVPLDLGDLPPDFVPLAAASAAAGSNRAVSESNPELNVDAYTELQKSMRDTEKDVTAARRFYWAAIAEYNASVQAFPSSIVAAIHGFRPLPTAQLTKELEKKPNYFGT